MNLFRIVDAIALHERLAQSTRYNVKLFVVLQHSRFVRKMLTLDHIHVHRPRSVGVLCVSQASIVFGHDSIAYFFHSLWRPTNYVGHVSALLLLLPFYFVFFP